MERTLATLRKNAACTIAGLRCYPWDGKITEDGLLKQWSLSAMMNEDHLPTLQRAMEAFKPVPITLNGRACQGIVMSFRTVWVPNRMLQVNVQGHGPATRAGWLRVKA